MSAFNTPILFLIFNRMDTTQLVFNEIRKIKPKYLYVAADGPRSHKPNEKQKCEEARSIVNQVDWDCEVIKLFRDENLGCRKAVSAAIDWFFDEVEEGIILEDDCLPNPDFFRFCEYMLDYYRDDHRIMHISGCNLQYGKQRGNASYYISKHPNIWGWATWRRAWKYMDVDMKTFPEFKRLKKMDDILRHHRRQSRYMSILSKVFKGVDTWGFQWTYAVFTQSGLSVNPNKNLISNIGFGTQSTHAYYKKSKLANVPLENLDQEITHPEFFMPDAAADDYFIEVVMRLPPVIFRLGKKSKKAIELIKSKLNSK